MSQVKKNGIIAASSGQVAVQYRIKTGSFTRDTSLANGNQIITGVGFKPVLVVFQMAHSPQASLGFDDGNSPGCTAWSYLSTAMDISTYTIHDDQSVTNSYDGHIISKDSDGFTIEWIKSNLPTGVIRVRYIAYG